MQSKIAKTIALGFTALFLTFGTSMAQAPECERWTRSGVNVLGKEYWGTVTPEDVQACIDNGTDVNAKGFLNYTVFHSSFMWIFARSDVIQVLLDAGADLTATDGQLMTPLHVAASHSRSSVLLQLLDAGANPNAFDINLNRPIAYARQNIRIKRDSEGFQALKAATKGLFN